MRTIRSTLLGVLIIACATLSVGADPTAAADSLNVDRCLQLTTTKALSTSRILSGIVGLTPDQVRELRSRLASYNSARGFKGLDGMGLTPEQIQEIQRRIDVQVAEWNRYPLGWPCKPFKDPSAVQKFVRADLIDNGFRPRMTFKKTSPRQFQLRAIQDGNEYLGIVVKTGSRQLTIRLLALDDNWSQTTKIKTPFDA